jgi:hypothetical protein
MVSSRTLASNPSPPICCCRTPANARDQAGTPEA